jgi:adenylate cyclase
MHILARGDWLQRARLTSGLILFTFALTHFLNHAVGLVDLETMHEIQAYRWMVTRSWPGTIILLTAICTHVGLGLYKLANRSTLRLPPWEMSQLTLGLLIPFLLFPHVVNTRIAHVFFGVEDNYLYELVRLWPASAILQSTLLVMVWTHGCIGIHFWLRLYSPYRALQPVLLFIAIAIPLAALGGFMVSGRAVADLVKAPEMMDQVKALTHWPNDPGNDALANYRSLVRLVFFGILVLISGYLAWRYLRRLAAPKITIRYLGGPTVRTPRGPTLLEVSRINRIPHAAICGGRARCSTCRVRIDDTQVLLPPPQAHEAVTLNSIQAADNVRLACQLRPTGSLTVTRLLRPRTTGPGAAEVEESDSGGVQKHVAVLFLNLRDFTKISRRKLPYDTVFILNSLFAAVGDAITAQGGRVDHFADEGMFGVFGQKEGPEIGCRQALRAARAIDLALDHVNAVCASEIGEPMRVGMGLHVGSLLIGRIGYGEAVNLTSIGPAMKTAVWLDRIAKDQAVQIVASWELANMAGLDHCKHASISAQDPDTFESLTAVAIARGRDLAASILTAERA